ncbi:MAG: FAD-binding protein, partial [Myxococcota bacterium]|nr:FAD-binding protein [Myxococcota bacterium]
MSLEFQENIPYKELGYWRIGGPVQTLFRLRTADELSSLCERGDPIHILGNGSNMLVADEGISGNSVLLEGEFKAFEIREQENEQGHLYVGAGMKNVVLLNRLKRLGWTGLSSLAGIPGTVGGAIRMNAGSILGEICDAV